MSINILAILLSFAMMLTGAGGEGQPAEAARTLVLHNVSITYNGETVNLAPALRLGAATDGEKAVFNAGVDVDGDTLFPMQLGVGENGVTALFEKSDVAVNVSADALNALSEQANQMLSGLAQGDDESAQLFSFLMDEYMPAYAGMLEAVQDADFREAFMKQSSALYGEMIDRGEGTPVTETIDGEEYALNEYNYTVDSGKMAEFIDAFYTSNDVMKAYYDAMFKMYALMPEESGLNDMHSYVDMFDKLNLNMTMDVNEKMSDDGEIDLMDAVLTIDMSGMIESMGEMDAEDVPEIQPIVMNIQSSQVGEAKDATMTCSYAIDETAVDMNASVYSQGANDMSLTIDMAISEEDNSVGSLNMVATMLSDSETGDKTFAINYTFDADGTYLGFMATGVEAADGTGTSNFNISVNADEVNAAVSFDLDVTADPIEDKANGHEAAVTINDLSEEALNGLGEDQAFQAAMMQVVGSLSADAQKLTADESVQQMIALFTAEQEVEVEDYDYDDGSFEGEEEGEEEYTYEEPEDDGELGFNQPEFTWLPDGWTVESTDVDTVYDWVSISLEGSGSDYAYATFYPNVVSDTVNYIVQEDGSIEAVDGCLLNLTDYGAGNVTVSLEENGVSGSIMFYSENLDVETIGKIVAGLKF